MSDPSESAAGRVLGLDIGDATLGLALSDETRLIASPLKTLRRAGLAADVAALRTLVAAHEVTLLVAGVPRRLDGRGTEQTRKTERTIAALGEALGLAIATEDETWTTVAAKRTLLEAGARRHKASGALDQLAATFILQLWLDRQRAARAGASPA